jgi:hypothetical protein
MILGGLKRDAGKIFAGHCHDLESFPFVVNRQRGRAGPRFAQRRCNRLLGARRHRCSGPVDARPGWLLQAEEKHGFIIADYDADSVVIRHFKWDRDIHSVADIDTLEAYKVTVLKRPG